MGAVVDVGDAHGQSAIGPVATLASRTARHRVAGGPSRRHGGRGTDFARQKLGWWFLFALVGAVVLLPSWWAGTEPAHLALPPLGGRTVAHSWAGGPAVTLTPAQGPVGTKVNVSGRGFPANSTISLAVAGSYVPSGCAANASGDFGGPACVFTVPWLPGGNVTVTASSPWQASGFARAGQWPTGLAYDSADTELFVGNQYSDNVSVVNATTGRVLASPAVGGDPLGVAVDSAKGEVFVANANTSNISVISEATNRVTHTIAVGSRLVGIAYDAAKGELFVTDSASNVVYVVNDTNLSVVATIGVQDRPQDVQYVASLQRLFVENAFGSCGYGGCGSVSVIADSNDTVLTNVTVGANPTHAAYDTKLGELFVLDKGSADVSIISGATDQLVGNVSSTSFTNPTDIAYDPLTGESLVGDYGSDTVFVIDDSSQRVLTTAGTVTAPDNVLYAAGPNAAFVTEDSQGVVERLLPPVSASANFTVGTVLSAAPRGEVGQVIYLLGTSFGTNASIGTLTLGSLPLRCLGALAGQCVQGRVAANSTGAFVVNVTVPQVPTSATYSINASDALGNRAQTSISVYLGPTLSAPVASPTPAVVNQPVTFTVTASGGAPGGYRYQWSGLPAGCLTADQATLGCTPSVPGSYLISVTVTDSNGITGTSPSLLFTVNPTYTVTFSESGLPSGLTWGVVVGSQSQTTTSTSLSLSEPNGTYSYFVLAPAGWVTNGSGSFGINGSARTLPVSFVQQTYPVDFIVVGLPTGASWSVTIANGSTGFNETKNTTGNAIVVFLANGTYTITFHLPSGYSANTTSTQITVAGRAARATVGASPVSSKPVGSTPASESFWGRYGDYLLIAGAVAVVAALALLVVRRRPPIDGFPRSDSPATGERSDAPDEPAPDSPTPPSVESPAGAPGTGGDTDSSDADPLAEVF